MYIIFSCTYKFHLYIIQIRLLYSSTDKLRSFVLASLVYTQTNLLYEHTYVSCTYQDIFRNKKLLSVNNTDTSFSKYLLSVHNTDTFGKYSLQTKFDLSF